MNPRLNSDLNPKCLVWRKPATIPTVMHGGGSITTMKHGGGSITTKKHGGGSIKLWGCFQQQGLGD